jgi:23S rRNA pseudouridine1911/1915/1917 synthase
MLTRDATVSVEDHGQRADVALTHLFPEFSRSQLSQWLKQGDITFNAHCLKPKDKVLGGELVRMHVVLQTPDTHLAEAIPLDVVFEDESLLVINKPAGLIVHPGAGNPTHTLMNALLHHAPCLHDLPRAGIVHRLDKDTTGLLIIAKTHTAHTDLIRQMQARTINRHYQTLVQGHVIAGGVIDTAYGRHPQNRLKMAVCLHGKQAITHYFVNKQYHHFTLLDIKLMTGRTHQIRVHMAHMSHPVVGDPLYGSHTPNMRALSLETQTLFNGFKRQALHAKQLIFTHPNTQERLTMLAPLPDDFQSLLTHLDNINA